MLILIMAAAAVVMFAMVSNRLKDTILTAPIVMTLAGLGIAAMAGPSMAKIEHSYIHTLAEITLVLILFSDAARINVRQLLRDHNLPQRLLLVGMPLTIIFGILAALMLPLGMTWAEAALLACILAPTDAALGQSVLSNPRVPSRIRQALNVESGLNDGIAVPLVLLFAGIVGMSHGDKGITDHISFTAKQIIIGPIAGIAVGWVAARLLDLCAFKGWMNEAFEGPAILATAALAYLMASIIGGNGFISAFTAGLMFGWMVGDKCKFILEFAESEGQALAMIAFLIFGAIMLPEAMTHLNWTCVVYALLSLTVIRMVPVTIALAGTKLNPLTIGFLGWFGPRGLASILFALLIIEQLHTPAASMILTVTVVTVAFSVVLHGITAAPFANAYANKTLQDSAYAEHESVSEMPTREGMVK